MPFINDLAQKARKRNVLSGLIIIDVIAFISYTIFPSGIFYFGDIQMILGCIVGTRFTLKNIKPNQSYFLNGIFVGSVGAILTGISFTMFDWVYFSGILNYSYLMLLTIFELYFIEAIIIGLLLGFIVGGYYNYKNKTQTKSSIVEDEFYESLLEK